MESKFLLPSSVFQILKYVKIDNGEVLDVKEDSTTEALALCQDYSGMKFITKFSYMKQKGELSIKELVEFFKEKSRENLSKEAILKLKDWMDNEEKYIDEVDVLVEEKNLDRKSAKKFEKEWFEEKAEKIALNEWEIQPFHWVRTALSSTELRVVKYNNKEINIYESKSIIYDGDKPSQNGLYYISKNRHQIPLKIFTKKDDSNKSVVLVNTSVLTKKNFLTLLNHAKRTVNKTGSFHITFSADNNVKDSVLLKLLGDIEKSVDEDGVDAYLNKVNELIDFVENDKIGNNLFNLTIFLPSGLGSKVSLKNTISDQQSLFYKFCQGIINLSHPYFKGDEEIIDICLDEIVDYVVHNRRAVFGFYNIISLSDICESDTYGWLPNNIQSSKILSSIRDSLEISKVLNSKLTELAKERGLKTEENKE